MNTPLRSGIGWPAVLLVLAVVLCAVRLVGLDQYPSSHPDEGFWGSGAKNFVQSGDALLDGRLHPFLSPATYVSLVAFFSALTPSLWAARLFSALVGLLTLPLIWVIARRHFPSRPWLLLLLFGMSSPVVLIQRVALLEAYQMFWLVLAAVFWLSPGRRAAVLAGLAYGVALLVKSNSVYLFPAFLLSLPWPAREENGPRSVSPWGAAVSFVLACVLVGGGGYLLDWAMHPSAFSAAFRYEVDGQHFLDKGVWFHVGRFGFHPGRALVAARALAVGDPILLLLAAVGAALLLRRGRLLDRADRFFLAWAGGGLLFHFGQVYVENRYLVTLMPAFAYLAARALSPLLDRGAIGRQPRRGRALAAAVLLCFFAYHSARLGVGVVRRPNRGYWEAVAWISENVPPETRVLSAPYIGLSLPQRSYDFYRMVFPYDRGEPVRPLDQVVRQYDIRVVVVDPEWHEYQTADGKRFLQERCSRLASLGAFEVFRVEGSDADRPGPGATALARP